MTKTIVMKNVFKTSRTRPHFTNTNCLITTFSLTDTSLKTFFFKRTLQDPNWLAKQWMSFPYPILQVLIFESEYIVFQYLMWLCNVQVRISGIPKPWENCKLFSHWYATKEVNLETNVVLGEILNRALSGVQFSGVGMLFSFVQLSINKRD